MLVPARRPDILAAQVLTGRKEGTCAGGCDESWAAHDCLFLVCKVIPVTCSTVCCVGVEFRVLVFDHVRRADYKDYRGEWVCEMQ